MKSNNGNHGSGSHIGRYREIASVFVKYRLDELVQTLGLRSFLPFRWIPLSAIPVHRTMYSKPVRTRMAIEELGTAFVKIGQILSTRTDILPSDYIQELAKLQNSLRPIPIDAVKEVIRQELKKSPDEVFKEFGSDPLGVASIGQAHAAKLLDGTDVVVKVQKPGVYGQVSEDMDILHHLAVSASERQETFGYYDLVDLVDEITDTMMTELDYVSEGRNAEYFADVFKDDPKIHIPKVFWEYTTSRVITLERIRGIGILQTAELDKAGFDRKDLAVRAVNIWLKMIFEENIFHADPHPGNLFVEPDGRLGLVDFGMVGVIDIDVRNSLVNVVRSIMDNDVDFLVDSLLDLGALSSVISREGLRKDIKHLWMHLPMIVSRRTPLSSLGDLFAVIRRNKVKLPANTFVLLKTMAMAQSLGVSLDSAFDYFQLVLPRVDQELKNRYKPSAILRRLPRAIGDFALFGAGLPTRVMRIVRSIERGDFQIKTDVSGIERHMEHLERIINRVVAGLIVSAVILGLALIYLAYRTGH